MNKITPLKLFHLLLYLGIKRSWAIKIASRYMFSFLYRENIHVKRIMQMLMEEDNAEEV